jgi:uncharacterized membrane protein YfcA
MKTHLFFTIAAVALALWIAPDQLPGMFGLILLANGGLFLLKKIEEPVYADNETTDGDAAAAAQREAA